MKVNLLKASIYCACITGVYVILGNFFGNDDSLNSQKNYSTLFASGIFISALFLYLSNFQRGSYFREQPTKSVELEIAFYYSVLFWGGWVLYMDFSNFDNPINKISGVALFAFINGLVGVSSLGHWPFSDESSKELALKNKGLFIVCMVFVITGSLLAVLILIFAPFEWRGHSVLRN